MQMKEIRQCFAEKFGNYGDIRSYFAPGRVNRSVNIPIIMEGMCFPAHSRSERI